MSKHATSEEVAAHLRISLRTLQRLTHDGSVPSVRLGGARLYRWSDLWRYEQVTAAEVFLGTARGPLLTEEEACALLDDIPLRKLRQMAEEGKLPAIRIGRGLRFRRSALERVRLQEANCA